MLKKLYNKSVIVNITRSIRQNIKNKIVNVPDATKNDIINTKNVPSVDFAKEKEEKSVLEPCTEDISHYAPYLKSTFNFAAYVNRSHTLQQLLKMGVNLHKLEQNLAVPPFILGLDFETDIKKYVTFFHDLGLSVGNIASLITKNPFILKQTLDDLSVRINYLQSKQFTDDDILRIIKTNPFWLMFSTERIDRRLGFFQKEFSLRGDEVRTLASKQPTLITYNMKSIKLNIFVLKEEMGFTPVELKRILLIKPKIFVNAQNKLLKTYEYIHKVMNIPLEMIVEFPEVLTCREIKVKQRHLFLKYLGKAQYDPKVENYVAIITLVAGSDVEFCINVAKTTLQSYNMFLKTL